jgi:hypothetical protein
MDAARGTSAASMNGNDAGGGALHQLSGMIRKRGKRIGRFGHMRALQE